MHANSFELFKRHGLPLFQDEDQVLEIGPDFGPQSLARLVKASAAVDYHWTDLRIPTSADRNFVRMHSEETIRAGSGRFDVVFCANVVEHVRKPWAWVKEVARILTPGGHFVSVSPVSWPYHAVPVDCWRLYPEAYKALFEEAGLEHVFSACESLVPIDDCWRHEHGDCKVLDTIAIGRKPIK